MSADQHVQPFFANDPMGFGVQFFDTADEARACAEKALEDYRDCADEGWDETVTSICWGRVCGGIVETERRPCEPGEYEFDEWVDYGLRPPAERPVRDER